MNYRDIQKTMKIGIMGANYVPPVEMSQPEKGRWLIARSAELGCDCLHYSVDFPETDEEIGAIRDLLDKTGVELELRAVRGIYELAGPGAAQARQSILDRIVTMKRLGSRIMRSGYGSLRIEMSRFAPDGREQLRKIEASLKEAARIMEDQDVYLAIENHCDFKASDLANVFEAVDSPHVGCALDTANGYTVFNDPDLEVAQLAPYALTTHMKDMLMVQETVGPRIPFRPIGTALGEGSVNLPLAIETLTRKARSPIGLHMIVELGWIRYEADATPAQKAEIANGMLHRSIDYLRNYLRNA